MNYSPSISKVKDHIEQEFGYTVDVTPGCLKYAKYVVGRVSYKRKWVKIDEPVDKYALMTLLHEAGHCQSAIFIKELEEYYDKKDREELAFLCGWYIRKKLRIPIKRIEWEKFHEDN